MDFSALRTERDRVDQLVNMGQFGPSPASKVFLEAVNNANRTLGQFSEGDVDETAVNQALTEVAALVSTAPEGAPREALNGYLKAADEAKKNPNAVESRDSGGGIIGDTDKDKLGGMTGGVGVVTEPAVSKEELVIIQTLRDKTSREEQCNQAINQTLAQFNCNLAAMFQVGGNLVPTDQIVNGQTFTVVIKSVAK